MRSSPPGTSSCVETLGERHQRCPALNHMCKQTLPPPPPPDRPFASVRFDPLAWSSGSDQRRISGCGIRWLLTGPDSLPLWLCRVCAFVLLRCFSCSHTVLPKEHSLGIIFFSSLSSCKCCIFLQFYLHFTTDYTCMIVYVTNNKEPWTLNLISQNWRPDVRCGDVMTRMLKSTWCAAGASFLSFSKALCVCQSIVFCESVTIKIGNKKVYS